MDITCPQCKTEYEFEDAKVTEAGVTVKCTSCNYTFKVKRKAIIETEPLEPQGLPAQDPAHGSPANERSWTVRSPSGQSRQFKELTTLQQWIVERKVTREDQISKSGESWKRLGDIAELSSFFQVVDAAVAAEAQVRAASSSSGAWSAGSLSSASGGPQFEDAGALGTSSRSSEPAFAANGADFAAVGPSAAWESGGASRLSKGDEELEDDGLPRRATGKIIGISLVVGVLILGVVLGILNKDKLAGLFSSDSGQVDEAYQAGRKLLLMDDLESLKQADLQLAKAPADSALVQGARAEVHTTWAQHLREEAELLERRARLLESESSEQAGQGSAGVKVAQPAASETPQALRLRASRLKDEADKKLIQAGTYARKAFKLAPERGEVKRAMTDYLRLMGHNDQETAKSLEQMRQELSDDPEALYVEAAYWVSKGRLTRAEDLLEKALAQAQARFGQRLLRASLLLGLLELKTGRREEARNQARALLEVNASHELAQLLLDLVEAEDQAAAAAKPQEPAAGAGPGVPVEPAPTDPEPVAGKEPQQEREPAGGDGSKAPTSYDGLVRQGNALSERGGRTMQAFTLFERALKINPNGVEALGGIGYCHLDQERFAAAISSFKRALSISPTYGEALIGMAEAYKVQGNLTKSLDYYRAYLRAHPGGSKTILAQRNVADLERRTGATPESPTPAPPAPDPAPAPAPSEPDPSALEGTEAPAPDSVPESP